ncbi:hypothetical protein C8Q80DRAFT_861761 [Daedaleopsis nitida]|nr:hypothetical protein C8Q80DRAFT_861761 [Daedaleopsis nitida]
MMYNAAALSVAVGDGEAGLKTIVEDNTADGRSVAERVVVPSVECLSLTQWNPRSAPLSLCPLLKLVRRPSASCNRDIPICAVPDIAPKKRVCGVAPHAAPPSRICAAAHDAVLLSCTARLNTGSARLGRLEIETSSRPSKYGTQPKIANQLTQDIPRAASHPLHSPPLHVEVCRRLGHVGVHVRYAIRSIHRVVNIQRRNFRDDGQVLDRVMATCSFISR